MTHCGEREDENTLADGRRFVQLNTGSGDGTFPSNTGVDISVDSGTIGCIRVSDIKTFKHSNLAKLSAVVTFDKPFTVWREGGRDFEYDCNDGDSLLISDGGIMHFGDFTIDVRYPEDRT